MGTAAAWILAAVVALPLLALALMYNGLVLRRNRVENAFASIDALLKKRYDLIPNLVATVKGYARHEREVFREVAELRGQAMSGRLSSSEAVAVNNRISQALFGLMGVVEDYPELKADRNFLHLQRSLNEVEEQISAARRAFNAAVTDLNDSVGMFPSNIVASLFGFKRHSLFEITAAERMNPDVGRQLDDA